MHRLLIAAAQFLPGAKGRLFTRVWASKRFLLKFRRDQRGTILIAIGLMIPMLLAFVGLAAEIAWWYHSKRVMQAAADAAAIAGAYELERDPAISDFDLRKFAELEAGRNGYGPPQVNLTVGTPPSEGIFSGDVSAVEVVLTQTRGTVFAGFANFDSLTISARAVAKFTSGGSDEDACIIGLREIDTAVSINGNPDVTLTGCNIHSNGDLSIKGNALLNAQCVSALGTVSYDTDNLTVGCGYDGIRQGEDTGFYMEDPFGGLVVPSYSSAGCLDNMDADTLDPGVYCGNFVINEDKTLSAGTYFMHESNLRINADVTVGGSGPVVIIFVGPDGGQIDINGSATVNLWAPTPDELLSAAYGGLSDTVTADGVDGATAWGGVLFHSDVVGATSKFNGTSEGNLSGALHFPDSTIWINGNNTTDPLDQCLQVIADQVVFRGTAAFSTIGCDPDYDFGSSATMMVGLVE